jgi:hypothetical protein
MRPLLPPYLTMAMALRAQIRVLAAVTCIVLLLALTIDFAEHAAAVLSAGEAAGHPGPILRYALYRSADILLRQMPIIAIATGFLAEALRVRRGEAVILAAAGATRMPAVAAILILALALGALQTVLESRLRPAAVWAQVDLGLGDYATRFGPRRTGFVWIDLPAGALRAQALIDRDAPALENALFLPAPGAASGAVIVEAARLNPLDLASPDIAVGTLTGDWSATEATFYLGRDETQAERRDQVTLALGLDPLRVAYLGVPSFYLTQPVLERLRLGPLPSADIETAVARRVWSWALPGAFLLLGLALAARVIPSRGLRPVPLLAGLFAAYLSTVALRVFWALSEMGSLPAAVAVATPLAGVWAVAAGLLILERWRGPGG